MHALHIAGDDADAALAAGASVIDAWLRVGEPAVAAAHIARLHAWLARSDAAMRRHWQDIEAEVDRLRREPALAPDGLPVILFPAVEPADEASFQGERPWVATVNKLRSLALRCAIGGHAALARSCWKRSESSVRLGDGSRRSGAASPTRPGRWPSTALGGRSRVWPMGLRNAAAAR